jgi:hypothetical protein
MQKGHVLQFECQSCHHPVCFSVFDLEKQHDAVNCSNCNKNYTFDDPVLKRQLRKFEMLCRQIVDSEEILAHTAVGVDVGGQSVKIPYKLLLTRLTSTLELIVGDKKIAIEFRLEPLKDLPEQITNKPSISHKESKAVTQKV